MNEMTIVSSLCIVAALAAVGCWSSATLAARRERQLRELTEASATNLAEEYGVLWHRSWLILQSLQEGLYAQPPLSSEQLQNYLMRELPAAMQKLSEALQEKEEPACK